MNNECAFTGSEPLAQPSTAAGSHSTTLLDSFAGILYTISRGSLALSVVNTYFLSELSILTGTPAMLEGE